MSLSIRNKIERNYRDESQTAIENKGMGMPKRYYSYFPWLRTAPRSARLIELRDLKRELATAKDKIADLNVEVSQSRHVISELEKQPRPLDQQTAEILRECARQWVAEQQEPEPKLPRSPFVLPPLLGLEHHTNGQATNNG